MVDNIPSDRNNVLQRNFTPHSLIFLDKRSSTELQNDRCRDDNYAPPKVCVCYGKFKLLCQRAIYCPRRIILDPFWLLISQLNVVNLNTKEHDIVGISTVRVNLSMGLNLDIVLIVIVQ